MYKGYRLEIKPNKKQRELMAKSAGTARKVYNWKLGQLNEQYEQWKALDNPDIPKPSFGSAYDWSKEWTKFKKQPGNEWMLETSSHIPVTALNELEKAFKNFWGKRAKHPIFKKKDKHCCFSTRQEWVDESHIRIGKVGQVKLKQKGYAVKEHTNIKRLTVSRQADRWFASFFLELDDSVMLPKPDYDDITEKDIIGVDLGIKTLGVVSNGTEFENLKPYKKKLKKLKRCQRVLSRRMKGSNNRNKAKFKLAKIHKKIGDIRKDAIHKMTTALVKTKPKMIVIELLKPKNMSKNHNLAGSLQDSAFGMFRQQLEYKTEWNGIHLVKADQFYASSKYCSHCGHKYNGLKLKEREWTCSNCGTKHDRDLNAAMNLKFYGSWLLDLSTVGCTGINACRDERLQFLTEQCLSRKQEITSHFKSACYKSLAHNSLQR
jgi:putative transposase